MFLSLHNIAFSLNALILFLFLSKTSEPYVTEDELKLLLRGAELSGAIEEEEQVLELNKFFIIFESGLIICPKILDILESSESLLPRKI